MINQHVGNANTHESITKEQAQEFMDEEVRIFFKKITRISKNKKRKEKRHAMLKS